MAARDWFRALQIPVLPVGAGPVVVGSLIGGAAAIADGGRLDPTVFWLAVASVVLIQAGANVQKGIVESRDLPQEARRPTSAFVFDAGAVRTLGLDERALTRVVMALFAGGAGMGLLVVALRADLVLLVLGMAGFLAAYSYSGAPFKLSYRGIGEVSTFLAFGPIMFVGAMYAQYPSIRWQFLPLGISFGFLAAVISYARYFPAADEDTKKGKRTPVVRLGSRRGLVPFAVLVAGAAVALTIQFFSVGPPTFVTLADITGPVAAMGILSPLLVMVVGTTAAFQLRSGRPDRVERGVRAAVLLHFAVSGIWTGLAVILRAMLP